MRRQRNRLRRGLSAAVNGDVEALRGRLDEELRRPPPLVEPRGESPRPSSRARGSRRALQRPGSRGTARRRPRREPPLRPGEASPQQRALLSACCESKLTRMSALRIERDGPVLRVTIDKPERRNAFDAELIRELTEAFADVGDARVVVLTGEGESFCAGADIEWQRSAIDLSYEENVEDALRLYGMLAAVDGCPVSRRRLGPGLLPRRRLRARRLRRHRRCRRRCDLRLLRGQARDHPGGHLAVRPRQDRLRAPRAGTS